MSGFEGAVVYAMQRDTTFSTRRRGSARARLLPIRSERNSLVELAHGRLLEALLIGTFPSGKRLPSEPNLAEMLGVSRGTVREALGVLQQQGHIYKRVGDGTYSADSPQMFIERLDVFESIDRVAAAQQIPLRPINITFSSGPADTEVVRLLRLRRDQRVNTIARTLDSDLGPLVYMIDVVPASVMSLEALRLDFNGVVRPKLISAIPDISYSESEISTSSAGPAIAATLHIAPGSTYLVVEETVYTREARPIAYSINHYNSRKVRFRLTQWSQGRGS